MEKGGTSSNESHYDSWASPREDKYQYYYFASGDNPWAENLVRQIQAQSYVNMKIVRPEGVVTEQDRSGRPIRVLDSGVSHPSGEASEISGDFWIEYALGIEKDSSDFSVETGRLVAWKKVHAALDALPAYQFCKDDLSEDVRRYLQRAASEQEMVLVEPEALGKTINADRGVIKEFIRAEVQRAYGKGEVWFMGLVEKTVYESWVHSWGPTAIRKIGESKRLTHPHNFDDVALVPTIVDVDQFYVGMMHDIISNAGQSAERLLKNFVYMSKGMSGARLGPEVAEFRRRAQDIMNNQEEAA